MAVRPDSASTLILTSGPKSQAPLNNINSTADPMMLSSMYHRQPIEVTLSQASETSNIPLKGTDIRYTCEYTPEHHMMLLNCIIQIAYTAKPTLL